MLSFPDIDPVILHIYGPFALRWYGLMYVLGIAAAFTLLSFRTKKDEKWANGARSDFLFYIVLGVILGGRIGYMIFYQPGMLFQDPSSLIKAWEGGMSFHGGLLGVLAAVWLFCRKYQFQFFEVGDTVAPLIPIPIFTVRFGNFVNGELWGRVTDVPWAMVFPSGGPFYRHPSQLYAMALEGILLFVLLLIYAQKPRKLGQVSGMFLLGYGSIRFFEEFYRQPDPQYGFIAWDWLTMGQILSTPMIVFGLILLLTPACQSKRCYSK